MRWRISRFNGNLLDQRAGGPGRIRTDIFAFGRRSDYKSAALSIELRGHWYAEAGRFHARLVRLAFWCFRMEDESLQSVVSRIDDSTVLESDFRAEHSPICGFCSRWFCHRFPFAVGPKCLLVDGGNVPSRFGGYTPCREGASHIAIRCESLLLCSFRLKHAIPRKRKIR